MHTVQPADFFADPDNSQQSEVSSRQFPISQQPGEGRQKKQRYQLLQLYLWRKQSLSVMIKPRHGLMSPSPIRPSPNMNQRNNLLPKDFFQEPSHFRNRQGHRSPRLRLNAVKLWKEPLPFFRRSDGIPCARMTVKKAWATMAKVMCRCHPVHERTS